MAGRLVVQYNSEKEKQELIETLMAYKYHASGQIKVCGLGSCGTTVLWSK